MTKEQQMQFYKLHEQQGIKTAMKQTSANANVAALEANLRITSQPKQGDIKEKEGEPPKEPKQERNRGNSAVTCQTSGAKHKEPG